MTDNLTEKDVPKADSHKEENANARFHDEMHEHRHCHFKGLNLGIIKLGVECHSLDFGVNLGIAKLDTKVGQETRADAAVGIGPVGAKGGAGVGVDREGLHADAGAGVKITEAVKAGAGGGANIGPHTGAEVGAHLKAGEVVHVEQNVATSIGRDGFNNEYKGDVGLGKHLVGVNTDAHADFNRDSSVGAGASAYVKDASVGAGAGVETDGNKLLRPEVNVNANKGAAENAAALGVQIGPALDIRAGAGASHTNLDKGTERVGTVAVGAGESGLGASAVGIKDDQVKIHNAGIGKDYNPEK